ncbi:hypothetical protein GGI10_004546, partial [Coemansia sp. RSA 2530]
YPPVFTLTCQSTDSVKDAIAKAMEEFDVGHEDRGKPITMELVDGVYATTLTAEALLGDLFANCRHPQIRLTVVGEPDPSGLSSCVEDMNMDGTGVEPEELMDMESI